MSKCFNGDKQSLEDILRARDIRVEYQEYLINKYGSTVVSYKLNIPGAVKYSPLVKDIFDEGLRAFKQKLGELLIDNVHEKILYKNSGPEYFAVFYEKSNLIKKITTEIEETHPLGRLYDFDVLDVSGNQISRRDLGLEPRRCFICEGNAFECGRSRKHDIGELLDKIEEVSVDYFNRMK